MTTQAPGCEHAVAFYDSDSELIGKVSAHFADALAADETIVFIATADHRARVEAALLRMGIDVVHSDSYIALDARMTLATFMVDGVPDRTHYRDIVGLTLEAALDHGRPVCAFGEMVALLWDEGNVNGAIQLEQLWNELADDYVFSLLCAYPQGFFAGGDLDGATRVCDEHSAVVEPMSYLSGTFDIGDSDEVSHVFVPTSAAVTGARRFVAETLTTWGESSLTGDASLVISELATNAVVHATSAFRVSLERRRDDVCVTVRDIDGQAPVSPMREAETIGGLGLVIVDHLAEKWGTDLLPDGKAVWCEFARRD